MYVHLGSLLLQWCLCHSGSTSPTFRLLLFHTFHSSTILKSTLKPFGMLILTTLVRNFLLNNGPERLIGNQLMHWISNKEDVCMKITHLCIYIPPVLGAYCGGSWIWGTFSGQKKCLFLVPWRYQECSWDHMQDTLLANFTKSFHLAERYYVACFSISCGVFQVMLTYPSLNTSGAFPSDGQHACSSSTAKKVSLVIIC